MFGEDHEPIGSVKYLLTFRPFVQLPPQVRAAYLAGQLHLLPFPGSLVFWGVRSYLQLDQELPLAVQIPLLQLAARHEGWLGLRVPQSGWLDDRQGEATVPNDHHGPVRDTYIRTHRWLRVQRHEDELAIVFRDEKLYHVLFSVMPNDVRLYSKPMARNAQIWSDDFHLVLDGPRAAMAKTRDDAERRLRAGGKFGYRFLFPAMRVGRYEVYWHRPLVGVPGKR